MSGALAIFAGVCSADVHPFQTYAGPRFEPDKVATIEGSSAFWGFDGKEVMIKKVDGAETVGGPLGASSVEVLPGERAATVTMVLNKMNLIRSGRDCVVSLHAEAGRRYVANGESLDDSRTWQCWIEDAQTEERTDGVFAKPRAALLDPPSGAKQNAPPR